MVLKSQIPTNKPNQRIDMPDVVYKSEEGKFKAVVAEIVERHKRTSLFWWVRFPSRTPSVYRKC